MYRNKFIELQQPVFSDLIERIEELLSVQREIQACNQTCTDDEVLRNLKLAIPPRWIIRVRRTAARVAIRTKARKSTTNIVRVEDEPINDEVHVTSNDQGGGRTMKQLLSNEATSGVGIAPSRDMQQVNAGKPAKFTNGNQKRKSARRINKHQCPAQRDEESGEEEAVFSVGQRNNSTVAGDEQVFVVDSGASRHVLNNPDACHDIDWTSTGTLRLVCCE